MKRKMILTGIFAVITAVICAQVKETQVIIENKNHNAVMIRVNAPAGDVEKALQKQLEQNGTKGKKSKGVYSYKNVNMPSWGTDSLNIFTRVEKNGNDKSTVYLAARLPNGEFISQVNEGALNGNMKNYLYDFVKNQNYTSMDWDIYQYTDSVKRDEVNYRKYMDDRRRIEDQQASLSTQMAQIEREYKMSKDVWDRRKVKLEELQKGRENNEPGTIGSDKKKPAKDKSTKKDPVINLNQ